jgi:hypothetical protein
LPFHVEKEHAMREKKLGRWAIRLAIAGALAAAAATAGPALAATNHGSTPKPSNGVTNEQPVTPPTPSPSVSTAQPEDAGWT